MTTIRTLSAVAMVVLATGSAAGAAGAQGTERFALRGSGAALYNLAGEVEVVAGSGSDVVVELTRGGADAARLRVERGTVRDADAVRVVYPDDRVVYRRMRDGGSTQITVNGDGTWGDGGGLRGRRVTVSAGGGGMEAWADARVRVPAGRSVAIHQGVGRVTVRNVDGRIVVNTAAAGVTTSGTRGELDVDVGSGAVQVGDARGDLRIDTGSGGVTLGLPTGFGAALEVETGSGGISVDVPVQMRRGGRTSLSGRIGDGDGRVEIDTGSGGVRIRGS